MPYTIPEPLNFKDPDAQLPLGAYSTYLPFYGCRPTSSCSPKTVKVDFHVTGYTKAGAMKIDVYGGIKSFTRKRKNNQFTIITKDSRPLKQVTLIYPQHKTPEEQEEWETYEHVEGEAIFYHPDRVSLYGSRC